MSDSHFQHHRYYRICFIIIPLLLIICFVSHIQDQNARSALRRELDMHRSAYDSFSSLFSDRHSSSQEDTQKAKETGGMLDEIFTLYYSDFSYRILSLSVNEDSGKGIAHVRITVLDSGPLVKDFRRELIKDSLASQETDRSLSGRIRLFLSLLKENRYKASDFECNITLKSGPDQNWEVIRTSSFENALTGELVENLSDPMLLSPEETVEAGLAAIRDMNQHELDSFLDLSSVFTEYDAVSDDIASLLTSQIHKFFSYEILETKQDGYKAVVRARLTSFSFSSILSACQKAYEQYMSSAQAVIDGEEVRTATCMQLLLDSVKNNTVSEDSDVAFHLINDGEAWKLTDFGEVLGQALFNYPASAYTRSTYYPERII